MVANASVKKSFVQSGSGAGCGRSRVGAGQSESCGFGEFTDEADDADEIAFAAEDAVGAQKNRHKTTGGGAQGGGFDKCGAAGSAIEEPRREAGGGFAGRQPQTEACDGICLSSRVVVAQ